ncbi:hypothetical protein L798_02958 [Zootermopsis nevadensis]|uniref:Uncharacterized protein n=1 Tax=Zootermopsis nevadensis TaxID=136037 RepID=A0A067QGT9_ZOONE|nr:hypothetical protein L798_02958 [Zootermopsis nevadensis]
MKTEGQGHYKLRPQFALDVDLQELKSGPCMGHQGRTGNLIFGGT